MRVLLIGLGNMGVNHKRVIDKLLLRVEHELRTCDSNKEKKANYTDYKKAIDEFNPQFVVIASPTPLHADMLNYCISKQIPNVFVEKPITDSRMNDRYKECWDKTKIMVGHIERYNPIVSKLIQELQGKEIDTIICTRSGLKKDTPDYNLHLDLCIHDADVCQLLTRHLNKKFDRFGKTVKSNSANIFFELNGVDCFLHADNKSPFKRREIKVMGPGFFYEGDYINQKIIKNGSEIAVERIEPLMSELQRFFDRKYTEDDLSEAIYNIELVGA